MEPEEVEERRYCESQESWEKVGDPGEKGGCQLHMMLEAEQSYREKWTDITTSEPGNWPEYIPQSGQSESQNSVGERETIHSTFILKNLGK